MFSSTFGIEVADKGVDGLIELAKRLAAWVLDGATPQFPPLNLTRNLLIPLYIVYSDRDKELRTILLMFGKFPIIAVLS